MIAPSSGHGDTPAKSGAVETIRCRGLADVVGFAHLVSQIETVMARISAKDGARLEANVLLVEENRLLIGSDPLGVWEFARPDRKP